MHLEQQLKKSEEQWLTPAFEFLKTKFEKSPLPSHDHFHHLRVWKHGRKLLYELEKQDREIPYVFVESLLLACMFHDSGMVKEKGPEHGLISSEIFNEFLEKTNKQPADTSTVSLAIEQHDNKTYAFSGKLITDGEIMLLPALNISDDLDAFGNIGIYRYAEIYLLRGIPFEDLGLKIIANLSGRYGNFMANCSRLPEMIKTHSMRHHTTESFFRLYNLQIRKMEDTGEQPESGPVSVVKHIYREVIKNAENIEVLTENIIKSTDDKYVLSFFKDLKKEIGDMKIE